MMKRRRWRWRRSWRWAKVTPPSSDVGWRGLSLLLALVPAPEQSTEQLLTMPPKNVTQTIFSWEIERGSHKSPFRALSILRSLPVHSRITKSSLLAACRACQLDYGNTTEKQNKKKMKKKKQEKETIDSKRSRRFSRFSRVILCVCLKRTSWVGTRG